MTHAFLPAFLSSLVISLISLMGIAVIVFRENQLNQITFFLISLATGALFGDVIIHIIPEIFQRSDHPLKTSLWILTGIFSSFVFEKFLRWKHQDDLAAKPLIKPVGRLILISDGLHNLIDGVLIGAGYIVSLQLGLANTLAVILHEIPHEIGDFAILLDAGYSFRKAILYNFISACVAILGVATAFGFYRVIDNFSLIALSLTAGSFLYIAGSNLTPELQKERAPLRSLLQFLSMVLGSLLMLLLSKLDRHF